MVDNSQFSLQWAYMCLYSTPNLAVFPGTRSLVKRKKNKDSALIIRVEIFYTAKLMTGVHQRHPRRMGNQATCWHYPPKNTRITTAKFLTCVILRWVNKTRYWDILRTIAYALSWFPTPWTLSKVCFMTAALYIILPAMWVTDDAEHILDDLTVVSNTAPYMYIFLHRFIKMVVTVTTQN